MEPHMQIRRTEWDVELFVVPRLPQVAILPSEIPCMRKIDEGGIGRSVVLPSGKLSRGVRINAKHPIAIQLNPGCCKEAKRRAQDENCAQPGPVDSSSGVGGQNNNKEGTAPSARAGARRNTTLQCPLSKSSKSRNPEEFAAEARCFHQVGFTECWRMY